MSHGWTYVQELLTAEWLLKDRANGSAVVIARSAWVSLLIYLLALALQEGVDPHRGPHFDWVRARELLSDHVPWLGAIFAGTYVAFYSRFASQWKYLADLFNQQQATAVQVAVGASKSANEAYRTWEACFIEDAVSLHLARKPMFAEAILQALENPRTRAIYCRWALSGGEDGTLRLENDLKRVLRGC